MSPLDSSKAENSYSRFMSTTNSGIPNPNVSSNYAYSNIHSSCTLSSSNDLIVASINIRGQTGLNVSKQKQIENLLKMYKIDILHCQEIEIDDFTFEACSFLQAHYDIIPNNSPNNKYGTASIVRNDLIATIYKLTHRAES